MAKKTEKQKQRGRDEEDMFVTLDLEGGKQMECQVATIFEAGGRDYIALIPVDEREEPIENGGAYLYRYAEDEEGNPSLDNIADDEEYEAAADRFDELLDEAEFEEMEG